MTERELFETFQQDVYKTCYFMLHHSSDAEDVCQEVFIAAFRHDWRSVKYVKAWLIKIAVNRCLNLLKKNKHAKMKQFWLMRQAASNTEKSAETVVEEHESESEMLQLFSTLPIKIRTVVLLRLLHEYSHKEISEMIGIPVGTVKSRLNKGMKLIRSNAGNLKNKEGGFVYE